MYLCKNLKHWKSLTYSKSQKFYTFSQTDENINKKSNRRVGKQIILAICDILTSNSKLQVVSKQKFERR